MYVADTTIDTPSGGAPSPAHQTANTVRMRPTLLGMASAHPRYVVTAQDSWELLFSHMNPQVRFGQRIVESTGVQKRHIIWDPATLRDACAYKPVTGWPPMPKPSSTWRLVRSAKRSRGSTNAASEAS